MKHFSKLIVASAFFLALGMANAQDADNPWQITLGVNAVDFYPTNDSSRTGSWFDEYFNANDHWSILPSVSALSVSKYLSSGFSFGVRGTINKITKFGDEEVDDWSYYGVDGTIKFSLAQVGAHYRGFDPFIEIGGGYTWVDEIGAGTLNGGIGFNFWFTDWFGLTVQSNYKHIFEDYENTRPHFQHLAGLSVKFGGIDTDDDGIYDKDDACPEVPGLAEFNGCPDTDGDGIEDSKDDCPTVAGPVEYNGCPDSDGDGIRDIDDACPTVAGLASLQGCPDSDGDGIADGNDDCPNVAGPAANKGCPWPDKDGDGVLDKDDMCPEVKGTVANKGCPEVTEEDRTELLNLARTVYFNTGKSTFKQETYGRLDGMIAIMKRYPNTKWRIEGHTDNTGSNELNQRLSYARADAVLDYFVEKGIPAADLTAEGYGEDRPIATNNTAQGRASNRRVEVHAIKN